MADTKRADERNDDNAEGMPEGVNGGTSDDRLKVNDPVAGNYADAMAHEARMALVEPRGEDSVFHSRSVDGYANDASAADREDVARPTQGDDAEPTADDAR